MHRFGIDEVHDYLCIVKSTGTDDNKRTHKHNVKLTKINHYVEVQIVSRQPQHKGNWYAHMNLDGTMGLDELAAHMSDHGTPYSKGVICGVLNDMVGCIKELVLEGNAVKLDNLAIFSVGIESKPANTKEEFNARTHITGYKLRARATGGSINARLSQLASINQMGEYSHDEAEKAENSQDANNGE